MIRCGCTVIGLPHMDEQADGEEKSANDDNDDEIGRSVVGHERDGDEASCWHPARISHETVCPMSIPSSRNSTSSTFSSCCPCDRQEFVPGMERNVRSDIGDAVAVDMLRDLFEIDAQAGFLVDMHDPRATDDESEKIEDQDGPAEVC